MDEAKRQVRPDGLYFEQALYYHVYALDFSSMHECFQQEMGSRSLANSMM